MSVTTFTEYAQHIQTTLYDVIEAGQAQIIDLRIDPRSTLRGYIAGSLQFNDGSELHFREFIDLTQPDPRLVYAYHYQDQATQLIFRYDNAAHKPTLSQPEHKHIPSGIILSNAPLLIDVLDEILQPR